MNDTLHKRTALDLVGRTDQGSFLITDKMLIDMEISPDTFREMLQARAKEFRLDISTERIGFSGIEIKWRKRLG